MGIGIYVQDINHKKLEYLGAGPAHTLSEIVLDAPIGSMIRGIHKYADTMFNSYQLKFFLEELAVMSPRNDDEVALISTLQEAANSAIEEHGYLWFEGD